MVDLLILQAPPFSGAGRCAARGAAAGREADRQQRHIFALLLLFVGGGSPSEMLAS